MSFTESSAVSMRLSAVEAARLPAREAQWSAFWIRQRGILQHALAERVPRGARVVFLDIPVYLNIGDLMLYLGAESWMNRHDLDVLGRWSLHNFEYLSLPRDVTILLSGGGNFGDLHRRFQDFRETVVEAYPNNRIVFLPQTIHYGDMELLKRTSRRLRKHEDVHLFLRDKPSLSIAKRFASQERLVLAPDMFINLFPLSENLDLEDGVRAKETLYLLRQDREILPDQKIPEKGIGWTGDWPELLRLRSLRLRLLKIWHLRLGPTCPPDHFGRAWKNGAAAAVRFCAQRFLAANQVVSSRLHGHLLASVLCIPNTLLDNSYGKNSAYFSAWHRELAYATLASTASPGKTNDGASL